ncbi:MAG: Ig-like domain-containing protein, partial [Planctomycetota bacterium]
MGTRRLGWSVLTLGLVLLASCAEGSDVRTTVINTTAIYSPSTGDIPVPNDLLFGGSTDGTLAIPLPANPAEQGPVLALDSLDGWSLLAAMRVRFSKPINPGTVVAGTSVRLFEVALEPGDPLDRLRPVASVVRELATTEFTAAVAPESSSTVAITPTVPFEPSTTYMVLVSDDLRGTDGFPVMRSIVYQLAAQETIVPVTDPLFPLQRAILGMHHAAAAASVDTDHVVISFSFTTQSVGGPIAALRQIAQGDEADLITTLCASQPDLVCTDTTPSPFSTPAVTIDPVSVGTTFSFLGSGPDAADVYVGSLDVPYYLDAAAAGGGPTDLSNDDAALTTFFRSRYAFGASDVDRNVTGFNPLPEARSSER